MAVPRSPNRWVLILLVVGLVGVGVAVAIWWPLSVMGAEMPAQRAQATVVDTGACGQSMDTVDVKIGEETKKAKLDACGHRKGETLEVMVPADRSGDLMVQAANSVPPGPPLENRLASLLLCLSALAGGFYAFLFLNAPLKSAGLLSS